MDNVYNFVGLSYFLFLMMLLYTYISICATRKNNQNTYISIYDYLCILYTCISICVVI
nr:MAG TPA: hypothetical protein [Caudoviricetes sp.]